MKTILTLLLSLLLYTNCFASDTMDKGTVGIFLEAPANYANNETVRKLIPIKVNELFPSTNFKVLSLDTSMLEMRTYREDNHMVFNQYYSQPLNRSDIQKIAKGLNCNYALFITVTNDMPRVGVGMFSISFKTTVTCDIRLLNVETGKYIISKQIMKDGSSTAILSGVPSFDKAYNDALEKSLKEIAFDTTSL